MSDTPRDQDDDDAPTGEISIGRSAGDAVRPSTADPSGSTSRDADGPGAADADGPGAAGADGPGAAAGAGGPSAADADGPGAAAGAGGPSAAGADEPGAAGPGGPSTGDLAVPRAASASGSGAASASGSGADGASGSGADGASGSGADGTGDAATAAGRPRRRLLSFGPPQAAPGDPRQRRRRRWFGTGVAVAAAILVVALCAGGLSVISAVNGVRDRAADARTARALRENDCLDLEKRLNRLVPPGSTTSPAARATAIRDENAAVRIYVDQLDTQRDEDAWRQLLDARTVFADALDRQAKSRTPAFFVAPRTDNGLAVADQLIQWSPAPCAGAIRRLAAPEL